MGFSLSKFLLDFSVNRPFDEWNQVFPDAACVVSLVDRLIHHSEIVVFEGDSYRMKEATEKQHKKTRGKSS